MSPQAMPPAHGDTVESRSRIIFRNTKTGTPEVLISWAFLHITKTPAIDLSDISCAARTPYSGAGGRGRDSAALAAATRDPAKMLVFLSRCSNPNAVFASCGHCNDIATHSLARRAAWRRSENRRRSPRQKKARARRRSAARRSKHASQSSTSDDVSDCVTRAGG
jgi:hypothetical protein